MNRLQLATILSWADEQGFSGRKRLQKVVFFLQQAGCPLDCHFTLHYYGPYSRDTAETCDEMVAAGLVTEMGGPQNGAQPYVYKLVPNVRDLVTSTHDPLILNFSELGRELIREDNWVLELGSTILFFYRQNKDWACAMERACEFKKERPATEAAVKALELAKKVQLHSAA